jgi:hypothetical protein
MYEVFNRRDLDAMLTLMHDEVEIEPRLGAPVVERPPRSPS